MLTKEIAIARLRATGRLATETQATNLVSAKDARSPAALEVNRLLMSNARAAGARHFAPTSNHAVLP